MGSSRPGMADNASIPALIISDLMFRAVATPVALRIFSTLCTPTRGVLKLKLPPGAATFPSVPFRLHRIFSDFISQSGVAPVLTTDIGSESDSSLPLASSQLMTAEAFSFFGPVVRYSVNNLFLVDQYACMSP